MKQVTNTLCVGGTRQKQPNWRGILRLFTCLLTPILVIIYITTAIIYYNQEKNTRSHYKQVIASQVTATHEMLDHELNNILMDCIFLTNYPELLDYLDQPNEANRHKINNTWLSFSNRKSIYGQVRFIDEHGMEVVRINNTNGIAIETPLDELQMKNQRYYFKKTLPLNRGDLYISPFDLNIEHGKIERPHKPVIRIATPIFDRHGNKRGIIILNYLAKQLFEIIDRQQNRPHGQTLLLNKSGFYLRGKHQADEWGFMFGSQGALKTLAHEFPSAWKVIKQQKSGIIDNKDGIFIYKQFEFPTANSKLSSSFQRDWSLVHFISNDEFTDHFSAIRQETWILVAIITLILIPTGWILATLLHQKQLIQKELQSNEYYLRLVLSSTAEGVIGIDPKGRTIFVNVAAKNMVGFSQDELIGKYFHDWIYHENNNSKSHLIAECQIINSLKSGGQHQIKLETFYHKDGSHFPVECQVMPLIEQGEFQGAVITFSDVTDRLKTEQELQHRASFDGLTGIYNRLKFEELLEHALSEAKRYKRPVSLAMFDIDHFKLINDAHGHLVGDAVLKEVTALTQMCLREVDSLARWGGEEFMILAPETTLDGVTKIAEKIRNTIACHRFSSVGQVTISFGIAQINNSETEDVLLKRVDDALYIAKQLGRNRVEQAK